MSWSLGDRTGYGVVMPNHSIRALIRQRGRFHDDPLPLIGC